MRHYSSMFAWPYAAGCLAVFVFAGTGWASGLGTDGKPDPVCVAHDLKIWALIERHENDVLYASAFLVDIVTLLQDAKAMCARGDVQGAMTIYTSTLRDLNDHLREYREAAE